MPSLRGINWDIFEKYPIIIIANGPKKKTIIGPQKEGTSTET